MESKTGPQVAAPSLSQPSKAAYDLSMVTLGIETSGPGGSVALVDGGRVAAEASLSQSGRRHARTLVAELKSMLESAGRRPTDCDCVAVSIGPGSFTGLRVGVACAKTFAYATGCRLVAVPTLEAIAANSPPGVDDVVALIDAMRGDVFHARYRLSGDCWIQLGEIGLTPWRELAASVEHSVRLSGPALASVASEGSPASKLDPQAWLPTAAAVARIGEREAVAGRVHDLWRLEPLYIRKSAAEEKAEKASAVCKMPEPQ